MKSRLLGLSLLALLLAFSGLATATEILIWDYAPWRVEYYQKYADEYMKANPDVKIEVQYVLQSEYVDKIKVGLVTGTAPTMFSGHPNWVGDFAGVLEAFPHDLFPPDRLSDELLGYSQLLQDGKAYYYPLGLQGPMLFINEDHWDNAGIGAAPRTWSEAIDIGRRTTKVVDGVTDVAGFYFIYDMMTQLFVDLNYQHGGKMYRAGGAEVAFDEAPAIDAINLINDMYQTGISAFGENINFQSGKHAMLYSFAWRYQQIAPVEGLRWKVAPIPTLTGDLHPGMSHMTYYFGMAIPVGHSSETVREAFKFLHWAYEDEGRLMDLNSVSGTLPARRTLWGDPEIISNPVLFTLTQTLPYAVTPGENPQWVQNTLNQVRTAITTGSADPALVLRDLTRQINMRLIEEPVTWIAE